MYVNIEPFGISIFGEITGSAWLSLVEAIIKNGVTSFDEGRERLCLQNVRLRAVSQVYPDPLIERYGNKANIEKIIKLTFNHETMYDFDVVPSFSKGSKSYWARIKEGKMIDFVVQRLTEIPESKKAVMSFIHWDDYKMILKNPKDDYLPCITSIQFRLLESQTGYYMNTIFNARSIDAYQKASGNFIVMTLLARKIAKKLEKKLNLPVHIGSLDGFITDAHIYHDTLDLAKQTIAIYKQYEHNYANKIS